jgi:phage baseplate assembly protein gpV
MSVAVFPQVSQEAMLNSVLIKAGSVAALTLKLYSNNRTPGLTDVAGDYTEVTGGGYADFDLAAASFTVSTGNPSQALYSSFQTWTFTGATDSPGTVYGAFIVDANGVLISAEEFDTGPFTPGNGTVIKYKPRIQCGTLTS